MQLERTNVKLKQSRRDFQCIWRSVAFEGFLKVYLEGHDDDEEEQEECCLQ
jgi:DNA topoisomerase-1